MMNTHARSRVDQIEMRDLRFMCGIIENDRVWNEKIREEAGAEIVRKSEKGRCEVVWPRYENGGRYQLISLNES